MTHWPQEEAEESQKMAGSRLETAQVELAGLLGINIRGRKYNSVNERLKVFRKHFPEYSLTTRMEKHGEKLGSAIVIRASIADDKGREVASGYSEVVRGDGQFNSSAPLECAETKSIGRALYVLGLGGEESASADELAAVATKLDHQRSGDGEGGLSLDPTPEHPPLRKSVQGFPSPNGAQAGSMAPGGDLETDAELPLQSPDLLSMQVQEGNSEPSSENRAWVEILKALRVGLKLQESSAELSDFYDSNKQLIYELKKFDKRLHDELISEFKTRKESFSKEELSI